VVILVNVGWPVHVMTYRVPTLEDAFRMMFLGADPPSSLLIPLFFFDIRSIRVPEPGARCPFVSIIRYI
jgi:hypothetical protein